MNTKTNSTKAGKEADMEAQREAKKGYRTLQDARNAALMKFVSNGWVLRPYRCPHSKQFHLTSKRARRWVAQQCLEMLSDD